MKSNVINEEAKMYHVEYQMLKMLIKSNDKKQVDRRLKAIKLHVDGKTNKEIADKLDYTRARVGQLIKEYRAKGLVEFARHKYGGNNRSLSFVEEAEILKQFDEKVAKGEVVTASMIKKAFDERRGKDTGRGYIYMLLARHDFRMVMPRSKHPKKASDEEIETSKKLT